MVIPFAKGTKEGLQAGIIAREGARDKSNQIVLTRARWRKSIPPAMQTDHGRRDATVARASRYRILAQGRETAAVPFVSGRFSSSLEGVPGEEIEAHPRAGLWSSMRKRYRSRSGCPKIFLTPFLVFSCFFLVLRPAALTLRNAQKDPYSYRRRWRRAICTVCPILFLPAWRQHTPGLSSRILPRTHDIYR